MKDKRKAQITLFRAPLAPEQGTGPGTAHRAIKLRLLDRRTAPVSTAIGIKQLLKYVNQKK